MTKTKVINGKLHHWCIFHKRYETRTSALEELLEPKEGLIRKNPPKVIDGKLHHWCIFHKRYETRTRALIDS